MDLIKVDLSCKHVQVNAMSRVGNSTFAKLAVGVGSPQEGLPCATVAP